MAGIRPDQMLNSMTGFASVASEADGLQLEWEARSVNGKGLDLRMRLAEGFEGLEPDLRAMAATKFKRGSISLALRARRQEGESAFEVDSAALAGALASLSVVADAAEAASVGLGAVSPAEVLAQPGVLRTQRTVKPPVAAAKVLAGELFEMLAQMRAREGQKLGDILGDQVGGISALLDKARRTAEARSARAGTLLKERVAVLVGAAEPTDPARLAQELALLAVKADVTEELDRLAAHVKAAEELLAEGGAIGRKLDFLMQEFMREANTLCSKSGDSDLTQIGLDLKVAIDQMREQVQNLE